MLDLGFVRDNLELVKQKMQERGFRDTLEDFENLDRERRRALLEAEGRKARRNKVSDEIAALKKQKQDASELIAEMKQLKEQIEAFDAQAGHAESGLRELLKNIPNIPHPSVPVGKGEADNVEVRRWGSPPREF
jgi:seryl-tRNA synthetase